MLKMKAIEKSSLTATQKEAAMATFDACIDSKWQQPYSLHHFNKEAMPSKLIF